MKKVIVFDLDGTLTESKCLVDSEMKELLYKLLDKYFVAVISGGDIKQFISQLTIEHDKLMLFPTNGSKMYDGHYKCIYEDNLNENVKNKIYRALETASVGIDISWGNSYGDIIEDRGTQITFSALGRNAPLELKSKWDADASKRKIMCARLEALLVGLEIKIGGTTSIDITKKGINKAFAISKIMEQGFKKKEILFIGNDFAVKEVGVKCIKVDSVTDTKKVIRSLL